MFIEEHISKEKGIGAECPTFVNVEKSPKNIIFLKFQLIPKIASIVL